MPATVQGRRRDGAASPAPAGAASGRTLQVDVVRVIAWLLFVATMLIIWVSVTPFRDLSDAAVLQPSDSGNILNQIGYSVLGGGMIVFAALTNPPVFRILARPIYLITIAWFGLSALASPDPVLSVKRLALTVIVIVLAGLALTLPASVRNFAQWLAGLVLLVLAVSYIGVAFAPGVSIHNAYDLVEPELAGDWRGLFRHKNTTGFMMVMFIFIGLFVARVHSVVTGWSIVGLSVVFLFCTGAKTSMLLLPVVLTLTWMCERLRGGAVRALVALSLLTLINLATVGSVVSEPIKDLFNRLLPDASFTGRTDIWAFAVENIAKRPVLGHGFATFWRTGHVMFDNDEAGGQDEKGYFNANQAANAHNGYLDIALQTGLFGLALTLLWVVVMPLRDFAKAWDDPPSRELGHLFFRIWLFGINFACLESVLFDPVGPLWFMMLMSMFGLRLISRYRIAP